MDPFDITLYSSICHLDTLQCTNINMSHTICMAVHFFIAQSREIVSFQCRVTCFVVISSLIHDSSLKLGVSLRLLIIKHCKLQIMVRIMP